MPGLVIASRRWIIGSDDCILPGLILLAAHVVWVWVYVLASIQTGALLLYLDCAPQMTYHVLGQLMLVLGCTVLEFCIIKVSFKGSILNTQARSALNYLLYIRLALFLIQVIWEGYGLLIIFYGSITCSISAKEIIFTLKFFDIFVWIFLLFVIWCTFDPAGKSWVKMKKFQDSLKDSNPKYKYRRSKNSQRNWRHREALREYEKTWDNRCRKFCCILNLKNPRENSFAEIAKLMSEFFRDLDVVPSDVIAGLSLLRVQQKAKRHEKVDHTEEKVFQFLSGIAITGETNFLDLSHPLVVKEILLLIHYLHYSLAIYGWPMYLMANSPTAWCQLMRHTKCCANLSCNCFSGGLAEHLEPDTIVDGSFPEENLQQRVNDLGDNCCLCNRAAIKQTCIDHNFKLIYITYQVAVEKPAFFVCVDYDTSAIVISIRGTLSFNDVITDLNAEHEILPTLPPNENWFGHKGMVSSASYIRTKLLQRRILERAYEELKARDDSQKGQFPIVVVGHSLGAGTAAILSILLRQAYNNVVCFAFAPPGGLLSEAAAEYSKDFVISIVLGKDIVPRMGLHQMEKLRFDLIRAIKDCGMAKWNLILKSCCMAQQDLTMDDFVKQFHMQLSSVEPSETMKSDEYKKLSIHPNDESISLTVHTPLYPPGSIIHLVRNHPSKSDFIYEPRWRQLISKKQPIMQAIWAEYKDFNEILISPTMIKDHMPDRMLEALESLLTTTGPQKPQRVLEPSQHSSSTPSNESESMPTKLVIETSFTDSYSVRNEGAFDDSRLRRLRSLVRKGRAPLATPETSSLSSNADVSDSTKGKMSFTQSAQKSGYGVAGSSKCKQAVIEQPSGSQQAAVPDEVLCSVIIH